MRFTRLKKIIEEQSAGEGAAASGPATQKLTAESKGKKRGRGKAKGKVNATEDDMDYLPSEPIRRSCSATPMSEDEPNDVDDFESLDGEHGATKKKKKQKK